MLKYEYRVLFFEESRGRYPVKEFLTDIPEKAQLKAEGFISLLEESGPRMPALYCEKLGYHKDLYQLQFKFQRKAYRIFYFFSGKTIVLLHGIVKKTNQTPISDIDLSKRRMEEYKRRNL
jgi:phage-related protein